MTFFHLYYFPCEKQPAASPLSSPEEVAEEFLFIRGAVVLDHQSEASGLVLVLGQTELSEVPLIRDVVGVKPLLHLSQSAVHLLVFISAMEEHHLATEHLLDWALVEGGLGEGLGDVVAVLVTGDQSLPPLGVLSQGRGLQVKSLNLSVIFVRTQVRFPILDAMLPLKSETSSRNSMKSSSSTLTSPVSLLVLQRETRLSRLEN